MEREPKPKAKDQGVQHKAKECDYCGNSFLPLRPMQSVCGPVCAGRKVRADKAKGKQELKARKAALKTVSEWESECRAIVQAIARIRDRKDGCISCHVGPNYGGRWHGSHFRSVGACSALQFHLWNIHKACAQCNLHKSGNIAAYRPRLVEKIGQDKVDWIESQNQIAKRSGPAYIEYLKRFKKVMGKRLRRMEKNKE
jgi:hypothetical protein